MAFETRHLFNAKINGQALTDFNVDFTLKTAEERKNYIDDLISNVRDEYKRNYFEVFFDEFYKPNLNMYETLSDKINVCLKLERLADYLLGSFEVRQERKKNVTKYYFYVNKEEFFSRTKKESLMSREGIEDQENTIHFLLNNHTRNPKKSKAQRIFAEDFKKGDEAAYILNEYQTFLNVLNRIQDSGNYSKKRVSAMKGTILDDMIRVKTALRGTFGEHLKNPLKDSTEPSWELFDYTNYEHIKNALKVNKELDPNDDLSHIVLDLELAIKELSMVNIIKPKQVALINLLKEGYSYSEIGEKIGLAKTSVFHSLDSVAKKIAKYYKFKEDFSK